MTPNAFLKLWINCIMLEPSFYAWEKIKKELFMHKVEDY